MVRFSDILKNHLPSSPADGVSKPVSESNVVPVSGDSKMQVQQGIKHGILIKLPPRNIPADKPVPEATVTESKPTIPLVPPVEIKPLPVKEPETNFAEILKAGSQASHESKPVKELDLAEAMKIQQIEELQKADQLYQAMTGLMERILLEMVKDPSLAGVNIKEITGLIDEVINLVISGDRSLLDLTYRYSPQNYLVSHMVNVCILSLELAKTLGYNKSKLNELGLAALLHDLGMQEVISLVERPVILTAEERELIKKHIEHGPNILEKIQGMVSLASIVSQQHHERIKGTGYQGMTREAIREAAQIVGLADVFEAMTHPRPYRKKKVAQEVLKELLESLSDDFDKNLLRILLKRIGIYPAGSWVELNNGEIARVARVNERFLLRPVVQIVFNAQHQNLTDIRIMDLAKSPNVFIKSFIDESELHFDDKRDIGNG
jgi:HD-GYP domain-containing protein (c-di-GMP phosphodiesterase class II)